ncbi:MAG: hypothetical protein RR328_04035, partial [Bacteroidales bacterium]
TNKSAICFFLCLLPAIAMTQDFTDIHKQKPFQIGGDVSFQTMSALSTNEYAHRPFSFIVSLSLSPKIYGIDIPLSISFSKEGFAYSQAFNQFSFTPSYKWIKAYIGKSSMNFSQYGLSGHSFTGLGFELTPKNIFSLSAMYGQLLKARQGDTSQKNPLLSTYQRLGYGIKLGINLHKQTFAVHFFKATDRLKSLKEPYVQAVLPKENVVIGIDANITLYKEIKIAASFALSEITQDKKSEKNKIKGVGAAITGLFMTHRISSSIHTAYKLGLNYKGFSLSYERISPNYQSLGSYYFTNDFENIVFTCNQNFKKFNFYVNLGLQRDDLANKKISKMLRFVGSANINYQINTAWATNVSYSNFVSYTQAKPMQLDAAQEPLIVDLDTLSYRQLSQQAQWSLNYNQQRQGKLGHQFSCVFSFQESSAAKESQRTQYYFGYFQYACPLPKEYQLSLNMNMSAQHESANVGFIIGPSVQVSRSFLDKTLHCGLSTQYYLSIRKHRKESNIWGLRLRTGYTLLKKHCFDLSLISQCKFFASSDQQSKKQQNDLTIQLSYSFKF